MKVKSLKSAFYHRRIRPGEVFELKQDKDFSLLWMEPLDDEAKKAQQLKAKEYKDRGIDPNKVSESVINVTQPHADIVKGEFVPGTRKKAAKSSSALEGSKSAASHEDMAALKSE